MEQPREQAELGFFPIFAEIARRRQHIRSVLQEIHKLSINN